MTPNMIKEIISKAALRAGQLEEHDYLPKTEIQAENFTPHDWILEAFIEIAEITHKMESAIRQYTIGSDSDTQMLLDSLPKAKPLAPVEVVKDEHGYWDHPNWPAWDEMNTLAEINHYTLQQGYRLKFLHFEDYFSNERLERYFADGDADISDWNPVCDHEGSFLLSIYENEDGPRAVFAVPLINKPAKREQAA